MDIPVGANGLTLRLGVVCTQPVPLHFRLTFGRRYIRDAFFKIFRMDGAGLAAFR